MIAKILAIVLLLGSSAFGQWSQVRQAWNSTAGASPAGATTVTLSLVNQSDVVIASVMYLGTTSGITVTMTDGNGHNFTQTPNSPCIYSTNQKVWLFYIISPALATMNIAVTPSVLHTGLSVHAIEFAPSIGTVKFDTDVCANPTSGTTPINTPSITPANSGVLYAAGIPDPSAGIGSFSGVVSGSWSIGTFGVIASDNNDSADEWQVSATGTTSVNWTVSSSSNTGWVAMAMSMYASTAPNISLKGTTRFKGKVILK